MSTEPPHVSSSRESENEEARGGVVSNVRRWQARFADCSPLFWPLAGALELLTGVAGPDGFPQPEEIDAALGGRAGIRFERQRPVSRRRRGPRDPRDPASMYDARIAREGCVPTRPGSWHDLMNALVWATFPLAKRALHERQHRLVVPAAPGESARRPRELDALALLDEGGVVVLASAAAPREERALEEAIARGDATAFVFGHAIYEGLVFGRPAPLASVVVGAAGASGATVEVADRALAGVLADPAQIVDPTDMLRLRADERLLRAM